VPCSPVPAFPTGLSRPESSVVDPIGDPRYAIDGAPLRLAYLCDCYPAISKSFILREVLALRRRKVHVVTYSIRRGRGEDLLTTPDRDEYARTRWVLPVRPLALLAAHASAFVQHPLAYLRTLLHAVRLGRGTARGALWQLFYFAEAIPVWSWCRKDGTRHLHAHFTVPAPDVAMLVARFGRATGGAWSFSFAAHGTDIFVADRTLLAKKVEAARFVTCVSDFGRSQLMALVDEAHWPKIHLVREGIDTSRFKPQPPSPEIPRALRVLTVARLHPVKGHAILFEALASLVREMDIDIELTLVGDGSERPKLERLVAQAGLSDRVAFVGSVGQDAIPACYAAADVFCLPSFGEGVPVVLMEAMAMQVPVVASKVMGIPELVDDERNGLLVPPGRADHLAAALRRLAADPAERRRMGERGRVKVMEEFDGEWSADALHRLLCKELLGIQVPPGPARTKAPAPSESGLPLPSAMGPLR